MCEQEEKKCELKLLNEVSNHVIKKKPIKKSTHVPTACINCKKAHLACDLSRPCKRCTGLGKSDSCFDIQHKKRGRPKLTTLKKWQSSNNITSINHHYHTIQSITKNTAATIDQNTNSPNVSSIIPSSFKLTTDNDVMEKVQPVAHPTMTIFLSMDLCCSRISDESLEFLNLKPKELNYRSFYDLIDEESISVVSNIHRTFLDNCHQNNTQKPIKFLSVNSTELSSNSPYNLLEIANGSQTIKCPLKFKSNSSTYNCQFYLGGGLGGDLFQINNLNKIYMVCLVSKNNSVMSLLNQPQQQQQQQVPLYSQNHEPFTPPSFNSLFSSQDLLNDFLISMDQPQQKFIDQPINDLLFNDNSSYWLGQ